MDPDYLLMLNGKLRFWGVKFEPGLTDAEIATVEETYGFRFPPDLRAFLQYALPVSHRFLDWRHASAEEVREWLDWPAEGMCFDVERNDFWMEEWEPRPEEDEEACRIARQHVAEAPFLIPILAHRYLPAEPCLPGNPVFSVYQTDIIHYGYDLAGYFSNEFRADPEKLPDWYIPVPDWAAKEPRHIRFWDEFL